jgi:DNA polymerase-3 subunit alpha
VESIIVERNEGGPFKDPFDFIKRINQRTVNKKTLESLISTGGFDAFNIMHRAQYLCVPDGETVTGLEKMIRYGNIVQSQSTSNTNTLFGDLPSVMDIKPPQISNCPQWSLTEQLDKEKEITGIYLSGHPLDHYRFEFRHFGTTNIQDFNEVKESQILASAGKTYKLLCLVSVASHRISRQGNKFGSYTVEDYSGKTELVLFGDDYVKFSPYLELGRAIFISGTFRQRPYKDEYEFRFNTINLAENAKRQLPKQLCLEMDARSLDSEMVNFLDANLKSHPGSATLKISILERKSALKAGFTTLGSGFELNEDLIGFLEERPEIEVQVTV